MHTDLVSVVGAGGHGRVVVDALLRGGRNPSSILVRDDRPVIGATMFGCKVVSPSLPVELIEGDLHVAIGTPDVRIRFLEGSTLPRARWLSVIHPLASVSTAAAVGHGVFVAALAVVGPGAHLGDAVIVNHGAVVDHDCWVGEGAHIAPSASLGGAVRVGRRTLIGAGARVLPGVCIGDDVVIGAGAVVLHDVGPDQTWVGVPAHRINQVSRT